MNDIRELTKKKKNIELKFAFKTFTDSNEKSSSR